MCPESRGPAALRKVGEGEGNCARHERDRGSLFAVLRARSYRMGGNGFAPAEETHEVQTPVFPTPERPGGFFTIKFNFI